MTERMPTALKDSYLLILSLLISLLIVIWTTYFLMSSSKISIASKPTKAEKPITRPHMQHNQSKHPLFGDYLADAKQQAIPQSLLNLQLVGILKATEDSQSQAFIKIGPGKEKAFSVKQTLPGGAKIIEILDDMVVIRYRGRLEKLELPKRRLPQGSLPPLKFEEP